MSRITKKRALNKISRAFRRFTQRNLRRVGVVRRRPMASSSVVALQGLFAMNPLARSVWAVAGVATAGMVVAPSDAVADASVCDGALASHTVSSAVSSQLAYNSCDAIDDLSVVLTATGDVTADGEHGISIQTWDDRDFDWDPDDAVYTHGEAWDANIDWGTADGNVSLTLNEGALVDVEEAFGIFVEAEGDPTGDTTFTADTDFTHDHLGVPFTHYLTVTPDQASMDGDITIVLDGAVDVDAVDEVVGYSDIIGIYADTQETGLDAYDNESITGDISITGSGRVDVSWESRSGEDVVDAVGVSATADQDVYLGGIAIAVDVYAEGDNATAQGAYLESDDGSVTVDSVTVSADAAASDAQSVFAEGIDIESYGDDSGDHASLRDSTVTSVARGDEVAYVSADGASLIGESVFVQDSAVTASARSVGDAGEYNVDVEGVEIYAESTASVTGESADATVTIDAMAGIAIGDGINNLGIYVEAYVDGLYVELDNSYGQDVELTYVDVTASIGQVDAETGELLTDAESGELVAATVMVSEGATPARAADMDLYATAVEIELHNDADADIDHLDALAQISASATGGSGGSYSDIDATAKGLELRGDDFSVITIDDSVGRAEVVLQSDDYAEARAQGIDVYGEYGDLFIENSKGYAHVDLTLLADGDDHQGRLVADADGVDLTGLGNGDVREVYGLAEVELSFGDATAGTVDGDVEGVDVYAEMAVLESVEGVSRATITGGASGEDVTGADLEASLTLRAVDVDGDDVDMTGVTGRAYGDIALGGEAIDADISVYVNAWGIDAGSYGQIVGEQLAATNVAGYIDIDIDLTSTATGEAGGSVYSEVSAIATDLNDDGGLDSLVVVDNVTGEALISTAGTADDDVRLRASAEGVELIGDLGVTGSGVVGHVDVDLDATAGVDGYASVGATAVDIQTELELGDVIDVADITALADISATAVGGAISDARAYSVGLYVEGQAVELETVDAAATAAAYAGSVDNYSEISAIATAIGGEIVVVGDSSITAGSFSADADAAAAYGFDPSEFKYSLENTVAADARALVADVDGRDSDLQLTDIDVEVDASGSLTNGRLLSGEGLNFFIDGVDVDAIGVDLASTYNAQGLTAEVGEMVLTGVSVSSEAVSASVEGVYNEGLYGVVGEAFGYAVVDSHLADAAAFGVHVQGSVATDDSGVELEFDALDVTMSDIDVYLAEVSSSVVTSLDGEGSVININRVSAEYMNGNGLARTSAYGVNIDAVFSNEPTEEQKYSSGFFFGNGDDGEVGDVSLTDVSVTLADVHARAEGANVLALVEKYDSAGSITENDLLFAEAWGVAAYSEFGDISANGLDVAINAGAHAEGLSMVIGEADGANWDSNDIAELTVAGVQLEVINGGDITLEQSSVELTTSATVEGYTFIDLRAPTDRSGYADSDVINTETYGVILDGSGESRVDALAVDIASTSTVSGIVSTGESSSGIDFLLGALDSTLGGLSGITGEGVFVDTLGEIIESEVRGLHADNSDSLVVDDLTVDIEVVNELSSFTIEDGLFGYSESDVSYTVAISAGDTIQSEVVGVYAEAGELLELTDLQISINSSNVVGTDTDKYTLSYVAAGDDIIDSDIKGIDAYSNPSDIYLRDFSVAIDDTALVQLSQGDTERDAVIQMRATGVDTYTEEGMISIVDVANDGVARAEDEWSVDISLAATVNSNRTVEDEAEPVIGFIYAYDDLIDVEIEGIDAYVEESGGDIQLGGGEAGEFLAIQIDLAGQLTGNMGTYDDAIDFDNIEGIYAYSENGYLFAENVTVDANFDAHIYGEVQAGDNGVFFDIDGFDLNAEDGLVLENVTSDLVIDTIVDGDVHTSSAMVHLQTVQNDADSDSAHVYATNISTNIDISVLGEGHLQADSDMVYAENITGLEVDANDYIYIANLTSSVNLDVDLLGEGSADAGLVDIGSVHSADFYSSGSSVEIQQADIDLTIDVNIESAAVDGLAAGDNAVEISNVSGLYALGREFEMADFDVYVDINATADQDDAQITATALGLDLRGVGGSGDYGELVDLSRGDIAISTSVTTGGLLGGESGEVAYAESVGVWLDESNLMLEDVTIEAYAGAESLNPVGDARAESYGLWVTSATYVGLDISADEKITSSAVASGEASIAYANAVYVDGDYLNVDNAGVISANADAGDYGEATAVAMNLQIDDGSFAYVEQSDIVAADAFTLENSGEISAHVSAGGYATGIQMDFYGVDTTDVVINNREGGVISATADESYGVAIAISADSDVLITNDGTITGAVRTGHGDDSFYNNSMNTWNAYGESDFGIGEDSIINAETGRIVMTDALIDLGLAGEDGNIFDNQGLIEIVGDNLIDMGKYFESDNPNALENSGHIDFTDDDGDTDDSLMIYGDFSSDGGQISVDIDGAEGASDMLMISGDLEGTTLLNAIIHSVPHNVEEFAVQVVDVEGEQIGDISIGEVTFADDHLFDYNVVREWASDSSEQGWLDVSIESLSSAGVTLTSVAPALQSMWHQSVGTLAQRDGVQRSDNGTVGLWARGFASSGDIEVSNNYETLSGFELDVDGSELGIDFAVGENVKLGLFAGSSSAEFDINSGIGQGDFDGDFVGAFIQYRSDSFVADFSYRDMDIDGHVLSGAVSEKVKGEIDGYNIELGYTFALESGLKIQPQLQLSEANLSLNNLADVETTYGYFTQAEGDSLQSRVGVMFSRDYVSGDDSWTPYLTVSSIDESDATNDYEINGLQGISDAGGNSFALEIGINGTVGEAVFYGGLDYLDGGANDAILGAKAGIKFRF